MTITTQWLISTTSKAEMALPGQSQSQRLLRTANQTSVSSGPWQMLFRRSQSSDVEETNSGGTDVEIIVVELGFYDHVTTEI